MYIHMMGPGMDFEDGAHGSSIDETENMYVLMKPQHLYPSGVDMAILWVLTHNCDNRRA